jgi:hypothetical protein
MACQNNTSSSGINILHKVKGLFWFVSDGLTVSPAAALILSRCNTARPSEMAQSRPGSALQIGHANEIGLTGRTFGTEGIFAAIPKSLTPSLGIQIEPLRKNYGFL